MFPDRHFDWHRFSAEELPALSVVDSRRRLRICLAGFLVLVGVVFARVVTLEITQGEAFRTEAAGPLLRRMDLPGVRGRILARDGTVLAYDKPIHALAVHYRYLEQPPNSRWLRLTARSRLSRKERKDPKRLAEQEAQVTAQCRRLHERLAAMCELSPEAWNRRAGRVRTRVERIAKTVNDRRRSAFAQAARRLVRPSDDESTVQRLRRIAWDALQGSMDEQPPAPITVQEELDYHVMIEDVPLTVVAEIEAHPEDYPGVKIVPRRKRHYPAGRLAAHVLGHVGAPAKEELSTFSEDGYNPQDRIGRMGLERQYESLLRGRFGRLVETTDRSGRVLSSERARQPGVGRDLVLTLDPRLQRSAESLLDEALSRRTLGRAEGEPSGGAIVVMNVHTGAVLAAASAPRFDPNALSIGSPEAVKALLKNPAHPLFDRASKMAVPPGSVFKVITATALLEASDLNTDETFVCQGFLQEPDRHRCAIYRRRGVGHGEVTLRDALAVSCNVYFFHHAAVLGPQTLVDWARRMGFDEPTGIDLPDEASGCVPSPESIRELEGHKWRAGDTLALAIGQGSLTATPLQVVRMMAAIANRGRLVTPYLVNHLGLPGHDEEQALAEPADELIKIPPSREVPGLHPATLKSISEGLEAVVADPHGTAYGTVLTESIPIAGKTGTAQTGGGRAEHAWFAGYAPADAPKVAFVVVLEHAGNSAETAGPLSKRLVLHIKQLGYFDTGGAIVPPTHRSRILGIRKGTPYPST